MIKQFEIGNYAKKRLNEYLAERNTDLKTAMDNEQSNKEIAAILHEGFPTMVKKIYSLPKFETFFWEKRELLATYVQARLGETVKTRHK